MRCPWLLAQTKVATIPRSAHAGPSARTPISTSGNFPARVSAESPSNISPNPSRVISEVSELYDKPFLDIFDFSQSNFGTVGPILKIQKAKLVRMSPGLRPELPHLYNTLNVQHLVCTTSHLYNTSFVQNLDVQQLTCTKLMCTTPHLYNTLDTQHLDIQHLDIQHLEYTTP